MKRTALALLFGLSAVASQACEPPPGFAPAADTAPVPEESVVITAEDAEPRAVDDSACLRETGTKLRRRDKDGCTGAHGVAYSREQIDRSGAIDTADAIRRMSPSATVRRGH